MTPDAPKARTLTGPSLWFSLSTLQPIPAKGKAAALTSVSGRGAPDGRPEPMGFRPARQQTSPCDMKTYPRLGVTTAGACGKCLGLGGLVRSPKSRLARKGRTLTGPAPACRTEGEAQ